MTFLGKLVAIQYDVLNYTYYVFKVLNDDEQKIHRAKFITCVRFPNWNHKDLEIGDYGYINMEKIKAGVDTWFDGTNLIPYKYDHDQFIKLIPTGETKTELYTL